MRGMWRGLVGVAVASLVAVGGAAAQTYPTKPIRWILPYPPGGGTDVMGRLVAEAVAPRLGQQVIVVNQSGASGTVGSDAVRRADPDGYTLLFNASIFVLGRNVVKAAPYDPVADFTPVARIGEVPLILLASNGVTGQTIPEIVAAAKANPSGFNFGLSSLGSAGHLATLEFIRLAGTRIETIAYRGASPALTDLVAGNVQLMIDPITTLLPQAQAGRAKAVAVTAAARSPLAPDVPTTAEAGMPGLVLASWYGVWGPKGLPPAVVARVSAAMADAAKDPAFIAKLATYGIQPTYMGPAEFPGFMQADIDRSIALLRAAGFQPE
ncbi:tripartite-type tricarboxylate transporter receptor subunit TctC [Stella humosa]|uniref:Tripartite-type tricarboxylate transporter receptor subunit TctC n=1 Tax=Stella humosa TaxID=94 RepID=A0A3N1MC18_9PROT|nr:tripartite tricarboxylate transporter substrate binding protein [Stella humosa]ROQ00300.1 tripartite-type tricarboxylate transporter receptor subunit TctC [Stella humosa]BBK30462.1 MFS transporter [Stella humosa]